MAPNLHHFAERSSLAYHLRSGCLPASMPSVFTRVPSLKLKETLTSPLSRQLIDTPDTCCHTGHISLPDGDPLSVPFGVFCCQPARHGKLTSLIYLALGSKTGIAQI